MKKRVLTCAALFGLITAGNAMAEGVSFTPRAGLGMMNYSIEWSESDAITTTDLADFSDLLMLGTVGATVGFDRFYLDAYLQKTTDGEDTSTGWGQGDLDWDFNVTDFSLSLGYNVMDSMSLYVGYKGRETELEGSNTSWTMDYSLETSGFFGGLAFGLVLDPGVLSFNAAYVRLDGDWNGNQATTWGTTRDFRATDAVSNGFTIGTGWKGFIGEKMSYSIQADWYSYSFDDFTHEYSYNGEPYWLTDWDNTVDEEALTLRATFAYSF